MPSSLFCSGCQKPLEGLGKEDFAETSRERNGAQIILGLILASAFMLEMVTELQTMPALPG